jgi:hypothetical protein
VGVTTAGIRWRTAPTATQQLAVLDYHLPEDHERDDGADVGQGRVAAGAEEPDLRAG